MAPSKTAGYSGTPLAKKLGIGPGCRVLLLGDPPDYRALLDPLPPDVDFATRAGAHIDLAQVFVTRREDLAERLAALRETLRPDAVVWACWPKKASGVPSTVTEDTVREVALPLGFVDVKVCAIDAVWSGLKLVLRRALRPA